MVNSRKEEKIVLRILDCDKCPFRRFSGEDDELGWDYKEWCVHPEGGGSLKNGSGRCSLGTYPIEVRIKWRDEDSKYTARKFGGYSIDEDE
jgi:hypothetical protein